MKQSNRRQVIHWSPKMAQLWRDIQEGRAYKLKRAGIRFMGMSLPEMRKRVNRLRRKVA